MNGRSPAAADLPQWLRMHPEPDIVAVGFQEIVPLSASNVVMGEFCQPLLSRRLSHSAPAWSSWVGADASVLRYFVMGLNPPGLCLKIMLIEETAPPSLLSLRQSSDDREMVRVQPGMLDERLRSTQPAVRGAVKRCLHGHRPCSRKAHAVLVLVGMEASCPLSRCCWPTYRCKPGGGCKVG